MPARVRGDACCRERLGPPPVVLDAHDPPVAQSEDVEDLPLERLAPYLRDAQATGSHDHLLIAAGELERLHPDARVQVFAATAASRAAGGVQGPSTFSRARTTFYDGRARLGAVREECRPRLNCPRRPEENVVRARLN